MWPLGDALCPESNSMKSIVLQLRCKITIDRETNSIHLPFNLPSVCIEDYRGRMLKELTLKLNKIIKLTQMNFIN